MTFDFLTDLVNQKPSGDSAHHPMLNFRTSTSNTLVPMLLSPDFLSSPIKHSESTDLMLHPTLAKALRPRYVIVRGRVYVPPRSTLDDLDNYFEPVVGAPLAFFCVTRPSSNPLIIEERLWTSVLLVTLLNCLGIVVVFIYEGRRCIFASPMRMSTSDDQVLPTTEDAVARLEALIPRLEQEKEELQEADLVPKTYKIKVFTRSRPLSHQG
ncbi:hypothetical protein BDV93DRAFT_174501 [Ceratobasidium sp. AG-I]|nr:hypothetical protein BDV93DRAFT_174501 [Ceratobasidium sp. AG-I]